MNVQVRVCEHGALRNGRFAFTDRFTLVSELLQNARRAGATRILVDFDEGARILTVTDDGDGIEDFQKLLTFNESGWDESLAEAENAFGVGFSKCLYSARRVTVSSRGRRLAFDCDAALTQQMLEVVKTAEAPAKGTVVHLEGVDVKGLADRIEPLVRGFALPVVFNGHELSRPHHENALPYAETDIGRVYLAGDTSGKYANATALYLQGFLITSLGYCRHEEPCNVIHLDPRRFLARLPDRTELIDAQEQISVVMQAIKARWREILQRHKQSLNAEEFAERFFDAAWFQGHKDLFDDVPVLPRQACLQIVGYPILDNESSYTASLPGHLTREEVEHSTVPLIELDPLDEESVATWMYARARGCVIIESQKLGDGHWVHAHVRQLATEDVCVEAVGPTHQVEFEGRWIWPTLQLCEWVSIRHGSDRVEITGDALFDQGTVYYPAGEASGAVVRQVSRYEDAFDRFVEEDCDADANALADLVCRLRSVDPLSTLHSLLQGLSLERYPLLAGRTFRIAVGHTSEQHAVELVD